MEEGGSVAKDESTSDQGGGGLAHELDDDLAQLDGLDVMWGFDLDAFLHGRTQQATAAGDADDGTAQTIGSPQGGSVDVPSASAGRADSEPSAASTPDIDEGHGEDPLRVLSGRAVHELSDYWGRLSTTALGRTRGASHQPATCQYRRDPEFEKTMLAVDREWTTSGGNLTPTSWIVEDAMA